MRGPDGSALDRLLGDPTQRRRSGTRRYAVQPGGAESLYAGAKPFGLGAVAGDHPRGPPRRAARATGSAVGPPDPQAPRPRRRCPGPGTDPGVDLGVTGRGVHRARRPARSAATGQRFSHVTSRSANRSNTSSQQPWREDGHRGGRPGQRGGPARGQRPAADDDRPPPRPREPEEPGAVTGDALGGGEGHGRPPRGRHNGALRRRMPCAMLPLSVRLCDIRVATRGVDARMPSSGVVLLRPAARGAV